MNYGPKWAPRAALLAACAIGGPALCASPASASPIYWGATIGSQSGGDPYMPAGCDVNPPQSTQENASSSSTCTQTDSGNGSDPWSVFTGQNVANHSLSILPLSQSPYDGSGWTSFNGVASLFDTIRSKGAIPMLTMQTSAPSDAPNPSQWADANLADLPAGSPDSSNQNPGDHQYCDANGQCRSFDDYFNSWARAAANYNHPFFLRLDQEGNGSWFDWGEGSRLGNTASDYVAMWKHIHDIFDCVPDGSYTPPSDCKPATNVTWVWAPNNGGWGQGYAKPPTEIFPSGVDADQRPYVDWTGLDAYNRPADQGDNMWSLASSLYGGGNTQLANSYQDIVNADPSAPMMLAEFASDESTDGNQQEKADWITQALTSVIPDASQIKAALYYNEGDNADGAGSHALNYPIESSQQSINAFSSGINDGYYQGADTSNSFGGAVQDGQPIQPIGGFNGPNLVDDSGSQGQSSGSSSSSTAGGSATNGPAASGSAASGAAGNPSKTASTRAAGTRRGKAKARVSKDRALKVSNLIPGSRASVELVRSGLKLESDRRYTLSFYAKSASKRKISVRLSQSHSPHKTYASKRFTLSRSWHRYEVKVKPQRIRDNNSVLAFKLAPAKGNTRIIRVSLHVS
ncbi:MAG: carbohydrate binding domain-containing protein [Solirubrobacterales bacterium]|nr:carbohydrate binding domain-containing protein [Solirubrobacterales bacterium]